MHPVDSGGTTPPFPARDSTERAGGAAGSSREKAATGRDWWDKAEILARPVAAFLTALALALVGWFGQRALSNREAQVTARAEHEQNTRLYSDIMSRREEAASALRKDMFTAILTEFFKDTATVDVGPDLSKQLLRLEMLALNFGESLSLSPLFAEMRRDLESLEGPFARFDRAVYDSRLRELARQVTGWQLSALESGGEVRRISVPLSRVAKGGGEPSPTYTWPEDTLDKKSLRLQVLEGQVDSLVNAGVREIKSLVDEVKAELAAAGTQTTGTPGLRYASASFPVADPDSVQLGYDGLELLMRKVQSLAGAEDTAVFDSLLEGVDAEFDAVVARAGEVELQNIKRRYSLRLSDADPESKTIRVELTVADIPNAADTLQAFTLPIASRFELDAFDFPMIDNTRLSADQRLALVLEGFRREGDDFVIRIALVVFPGLYASHKDKPFLDVLIDQLHRNVPGDTLPVSQ